MMVGLKGGLAMRQSLAAVALIRREQEGQTVWLAQWNPRWQRYHFVSGHKQPDESFRQCMVRELAEELHVRESIDFRVAAEPLSHLEYTAWSESAQAETAYTMEAFEVELIGEMAQQTVHADPRNRWLTEPEIRGQYCRDGNPASPSMGLILSKLITEGLTTK